MSFAPYEKSQELLCKQEKVADCTYGVQNGKIMAYQLEHPYEMKTFVDPNILVFDNVDVYPQNICNKQVLARGNNNTNYRRLDELCVGNQCFVKATTVPLDASKQAKPFDNNTKQRFERNPYPHCI